MSTVVIDVKRSLTRTIALIQARGPSGKDGSDGQGSLILYGAGPPEFGIGQNEDTYIDTVTGDFYRKDLGDWGTPVTNMRFHGYSPVLAMVTSGLKVVLQVVDWVGGEGPKPAVNQYLTPTGWSADIAQATDFRGPQGYDGWEPVYGNLYDGNRVVQKLVDWVGGGGTKPAVPANTYLTTSGWTTDIAQATDIRGPVGAGSTAANTTFTPTGGIAAINAQGAIAELDLEKLSSDLLIGMGFPAAWDIGVGAGVPAGFLFADGRNVSRATYPKLFAKIGTTWGAGDGSSTFTLPDWRGRVLIGADRSTGRNSAYLGTAIGSYGGSQYLQTHTHTWSGTTSENGSHSHTASDAGHAHTGPTYTRDGGDSTGGPTPQGADSGGFASSYVFTTHTGYASISVSTNGAHTHTVSGTTATHNLTSGSSGNIPPAAVIDWLIYAGA